MDGYSLVKPLLFKGKIEQWPARKWTPKGLQDVFSDTLLKFRIGKRSQNKVQLETECHYAEASIAQFLAWQEGKVDASNPLRPYPNTDWWCYADYKYMHELFKDKPEILKCVDWSCFGLEGKNGRESTFWLGSEGAYTVCHYDTYGCNLVAQLYGRKQWVLFPPSETNFLYPTRIPYEESSVFSQVNILKPSMHKHPLYQKSNPHVITLEAGDVLFVPRHWWHFVLNQETSVSINMWIDMPCDNEERVREAVARTLMFAVMAEEDNIDEWLNPTEIDNISDHMWSDNINLLNQSLDALREPSIFSSKVKSDTPPTTRKRKIENEEQGQGDHKKSKLHDGQSKSTPQNTQNNCIQERISQIPGGQPLPKLSFSEFYNNRISEQTKSNSSRILASEPSCMEHSPQASSSPKPPEGVYRVTSVSGLCSMTEDLDVSREGQEVRIGAADIVDCVLHPEVLELIKKKVMEKYGRLQE